MKKDLLFVILLLYLFGLSGCTRITEASTESIPINTNSVNQKKEVLSITDMSLAYHAGESDTEEPFWEDERYIYMFGNPISEYVIVEYSDGSTQTITEALAADQISISDLDTFGIRYFAEPKHIERIVDHAENGYYVTADALEGFYEDDSYYYYFSSIRSPYIIVYYKDGTEEPFLDALYAGKVSIYDLDWFGIGYYKEAKDTADEVIGKTVFETDHITRITFYSSASNSTETEVPNEYLAEITEWLGTFVAGKKADDVLPPGADSLFVRIKYSDGTIIENSMSTTIIDGTTYLINYDKEPECYFELFAE